MKRVHCQMCGGLVPTRRTKAPRYCSHSCKRAFYRLREKVFTLTEADVLVALVILLLDARVRRDEAAEAEALVRLAVHPLIAPAGSQAPAAPNGLTPSSVSRGGPVLASAAPGEADAIMSPDIAHG